MAGIADESLVALVPATGVNNLGDERAQAPNTLREAVNVDINREGRLRRRAGRTRVIAAPGCHSLWRPRDYHRGFYVQGGALRSIGDDLQTTVVVPNIARHEHVSYARINDDVMWSNGLQCGMVTADGEAMPWAPPEPPGQPAAAPEASGGLDAGTYQIAVTYRDVLGREGGTGAAVSVDVPVGGGIRLTGIPSPGLAALVTTVRIYRTGANDTSLRHVLDVPAGTTTVLLGAGNRGKALTTQFLRPLPPGQIVRYGHGRQWIARENLLLWSPALHYGMHDPGMAYIRFSAPIDMLACIGTADGAGVVVAAGDRTYWLSGADPQSFVQRIVHPHGAVRGSDVADITGSVFGLETNEIGVAWLSRQGLHCFCLPGGQLVRFNANEAAADVPERAASVFRELDGIRQIITSTPGGAPTNFRVRDRLVATNLGPAP